MPFCENISIQDTKVNYKPFFGLSGLRYKIVAEMIFLYGELHIISKPSNVKICEHSIFFQLFTKNGTSKLGYF